MISAPSSALKRARLRPAEKWAEDAWRFYDEIGEARFGANWMGNALSRVALIAAAPPVMPGDEPTVIDPNEVDENGNNVWTPLQLRAVELVAMIAGGPVGQGQMLSAFGVNLTVAGAAVLVIEPPLDDPESDEFVSWEVYSVDQVRLAPGTTDQVQIQVADNAWRDAHPLARIARVWRKHPRKSWQADSPFRGVLRVLRQISLLEGSTDAAAESRLAGAGLLLLPTEIEFPDGQGAPHSASEGEGEGNGDDERDPSERFVESFSQAMTVPLADRASAASVVPLILQLDSNYLDKVKHISFSTPFAENTEALMNLAIRRLALGMDMPPEALLGLSETNHWNAWKIGDESVTLHIDPAAEIVSFGLTQAWLLDALRSEGFENPEREVMVWHDTTSLRVRPDRSGSATQAYDRIELSGAAFRRELGFAEDDAPDETERRWRLLVQTSRNSPRLAPGILVALGVLSEAEAAGLAPPDTDDDDGRSADAEPPLVNGDGEGPPPEPDSDPAADGDPPEILGALVAVACDEVIFRALERAGARLRSLARSRGVSLPEGVETHRLHEHVDVAAAGISVDDLLRDAWTRVPYLSSRYRVDELLLTEALHQYASALIRRNEAHSNDRLCAALRLAVPATV